MTYFRTRGSLIVALIFVKVGAGQSLEARWPVGTTDLELGSSLAELDAWTGAVYAGLPVALGDPNGQRVVIAAATVAAPGTVANLTQIAQISVPSFPGAPQTSATYPSPYGPICSDGTDPVNTTRFGFATASLPDVNGDGLRDLLVGAPGADALAGAVYVFDGSNGALLFFDSGDVAGARLGFSVAAVGDLDGDGFDDFVAGAPFTSSPGLSNHGAAVVYRGVPAPNYFAMDPTRGACGTAIGELLGWSVGGGGAIGGVAAYRDFVVGAPGAFNGGTAAGAVHVYEGGPTAPGNCGVGQRIFSAFGPSSSEAGYSCAVVGDVNCDGFDDVAMGLPGLAPTGPGAGAGGARVLAGGPSGFAPTPLLAMGGSNLTYSLGVNVGGGADVTGDWVPDVLFGEGRYCPPSGASGSSAFDVRLHVIAGGAAPVPAPSSPYLLPAIGSGYSGSGLSLANGSSIGQSRPGRIYTSIPKTAGILGSGAGGPNAATVRGPHVFGAPDSPFFAFGPVGGPVCLGASVLLSVAIAPAAAATGYAPAYQWEKDGVPILGATAPTYAITTFSAVDVGSYACRTTFCGGSFLSPSTGLTLGDPSFLGSPGNQAVCVGGAASFGAHPTAPATGWTYQWFKDGVPLVDGGPISGATTTSLLISPISASDAGGYVVAATAGACTTQSPPATLTVVASGAPSTAMTGSATTGDFSLLRRCGPPGALCFTAIALAPTNFTSVGAGWWRGLDIPFQDFIPQLFAAVSLSPPFGAILDAAGSADYVLPPGTLPPVLAGLNVAAVTVVQPSTPGLADASSVATLRL